VRVGGKDELEGPDAADKQVPHGEVEQAPRARSPSMTTAPPPSLYDGIMAPRPAFLSMPGLPLPTTEPQAPLITAGNVAVGTTLSGIYELRGVLGEGGMGQVFDAHDRLLNRRVAIKVANTEPGIRALRNEAQALAAIRHPSTVAVYHMAVDGEIEYLVMERIQGLNLEADLEQRAQAETRYSVLETLDLLVAIVDGLVAAHRAGISHRDIKPSNIMLAPGNRIVLLDFGLVLPEFRTASTPLVAGTPAYMAPEVIQGTVRPGAGYLADLYAVGVLAFQLLTGHVPFEESDYSRVLARHLAETPPRVDVSRPDVPHELTGLIADMLAKDPALRPQSAEAALWHLRAIQVRARTEAPTEGFSVLIVDDDPAMLELIAEEVASSLPGARIAKAPDSDAALARTGRTVPDILFVDLALPRMSVVEIAMHLRGSESGDHCVIVAVTGEASDDDKNVLTLLGMTRFVRKGPRLGEGISKMLREIRQSHFPAAKAALSMS
jgi:serine/threonine-protein kinase